MRSQRFLIFLPLTFSVIGFAAVIALDGDSSKLLAASSLLLALAFFVSVTGGRHE